MGKSKKGKKTRQGTRESSAFASPRAALLPIKLVDDGRSFDFAPASRPARLFTGSAASITAVPSSKKSTRQSRVAYQIAFSAPRDTLVCVRRKNRREVLAALRKIGKRGQRRPRRNKWSDIKC